MQLPRACLLAVLLLLPALLNGEKVTVNFYGEALCPYCARFTTQVVSKVFASQVADLMEFTYIPWGNARRDPSTGAVSCQHGPRECQLNTLISCVIDAHADQSDWFPVVDCIEKTGFSEPDVDKLMKTCLPADSSNKITECYTGDKGKVLQEGAYNKTQALVPPHRWVPWVTVNGIPLYDDYVNLAAFVCAAAGDSASRPPVCYDPPSDSASLGLAGRTYWETARGEPELPWGAAQKLIATRLAHRLARDTMGRKVVHT